MRTAIAALALALACAVGPALAQDKQATPTGHDPVTAKRAVKLATELRCLVCQNQSIAESNAELAQDLRRQIDVQIAAGKSDREIIDFMVDRYGDFVLYRPPFKATTVVLWLGPAILLIVGIVVLRRYLVTRRRQIVEAPLTDEERRRAEALLAGGNNKKAAR